MGDFDNFKVTDEKITEIGVVSQPDVLTGTAEENKMPFDAAPRYIAEQYNAFLDAIGTELDSNAFGASYFGLIQNVSEDANDTFWGKGNYVTKLGLQLANIVKRFEPSTDIPATFPQLITCNNAVEIGSNPAARIELYANDLLKEMLEYSPYAKGLIYYPDDLITYIDTDLRSMQSNWSVDNSRYEFGGFGFMSDGATLTIPISLEMAPTDVTNVIIEIDVNWDGNGDAGYVYVGNSAGASYARFRTSGGNPQIILSPSSGSSAAGYAANKKGSHRIVWTKNGSGRQTTISQGGIQVVGSDRGFITNAKSIRLAGDRNGQFGTFFENLKIYEERI